VGYSQSSCQQSNASYHQRGNSEQYSGHHLRHGIVQSHGYTNNNYTNGQTSPPTSYPSSHHSNASNSYSFQEKSSERSNPTQPYTSPQSPQYPSYYGSPTGLGVSVPPSSNSHVNTVYGENFQSSTGTSFPTASVSLNLSMNMTMGFTAPNQESHSQQQQSIQWTLPHTGYGHNQGAASPYPNVLHHSPYGGHADRTFNGPMSPQVNHNEVVYTPLVHPTSDHNPALPSIDKEFPGICSYPTDINFENSAQNSQRNTTTCRTSPRIVSSKLRLQRKLSDRHSHTQEHAHSCTENRQKDGNRPRIPVEKNDVPGTNLCRICGKTYARPSTLKTHLRTHSGERPYR
jgi:hypothetical protein